MTTTHVLTLALAVLAAVSCGVGEGPFEFTGADNEPAFRSVPETGAAGAAGTAGAAGAESD